MGVWCMGVWVRGMGGCMGVSVYGFKVDRCVRACVHGCIRVIWVYGCAGAWVWVRVEYASVRV